MTDLRCHSCGTPVTEDDRNAFIATWTVRCESCYYGAGNPDCGDVDHYKGGHGISPLGHTGESFAYAMWQHKRRQIEAWQRENGLNVPVELLDECEDWRAIWMAKFYQEMRNAVATN